MGTAEFSMAYR